VVVKVNENTKGWIVFSFVTD